MQYKNKWLLIGTILVSPLLVVPVLIGWVIALITCNKVNFLRKKRRYRSVGTRLGTTISSTEGESLLVQEDGPEGSGREDSNSIQ